MNIKDFFRGVSDRKMEYRTQTVSFKGNTFKVEISDTFRKMATGLSNHESISPDGGMLFIFRKDGRHGFWMLNMKFSIDIIWLDKDGKVVHMLKDAQPCRSIFSCRTERPASNARYVVELTAGTVQRIGLRLGDKFTL